MPSFHAEKRVRLTFITINVYARIQVCCLFKLVETKRKLLQTDIAYTSSRINVFIYFIYLL